MRSDGEVTSLTEPLGNRTVLQSISPYLNMRVCWGGPPFPHYLWELNGPSYEYKKKHETEDSTNDSSDSHDTTIMGAQADYGDQSQPAGDKSTIKTWLQDWRKSDCRKRYFPERRLMKAKKNCAVGVNWKATKQKGPQQRWFIERGQKKLWKASRRDSEKRQKLSHRNDKKPRSFQEQTGSCSKATSILRITVIDRHHPEHTLSQRYADLIQDRLIQAIDNSPSGDPQFKRT